MKLGFIGTGVITDAIVRGLLKADYPLDEIIVSARSRAVSAALAALSTKVSVSEDNQQIVDTADIVFFAVLPQDAEAVIAPLSFRGECQVVSLIATQSIENLRTWVGNGPQICRAIPLPSVADRSGVSVVFPRTPVIEDLFDALGRAVSVETIEEFDAYAVASAMMGMYFGLSETVTQWLSAQGNDYQDARDYLAGTFQALANTAVQTPDQSYDRLRIGHSTPGGLNEQVHNVFVNQGGADALLAACESVAQRLRGMR